MDEINNKMGKNTIKLASQGIQNVWKMRADMMSNRYTTKWKEIPKVY